MFLQVRCHISTFECNSVIDDLEDKLCVDCIVGEDFYECDFLEKIMELGIGKT